MGHDFFVASAVAVAVWMALGCLASFASRRGDAADPWWAKGLGLLGWWGVVNVAAGLPAGASGAGIAQAAFAALPAALLIVSSLRLLVHLVRRFPAQEDFRYADWRRDWGRAYVWRAPLQIWALQGVLLWTAALPVTAGAPAVWEGWYLWAGIAGASVWLCGFVFETVADRQLTRFRADPANKGKLLTAGLWAWSRHPNYFGEAVTWWGIGIAALPAGIIPALVSPIFMTLLLRFVSGVPMLERAWAARPGFADWARRTNAFFPWFPRR